MDGSLSVDDESHHLINRIAVILNEHGIKPKVVARINKFTGFSDSGSGSRKLII